MTNFCSALLAVLAMRVAGHGVIYEPPARNSGGMNFLLPACAGGSCLWFNQGCTMGCAKCSGKGTVFPDVPDCKDHAEPTIKNEKELRTWNVNNLLGDYTKHHPWRYPGSAPVENPCGLAGGWYTQGQKGNGGDAPPGYPQGFSGLDLNPLLEKTVWIAGSTVEVAWGITANHGGGYQYRLCPVGSKADEECFQKLPLEFVGDVQWIQQGHGMDVSNRTQIKAVRITGDKVKPANSIWTRNPIPACNTPISGGAIHSPCTGPMFPSPLPGGVGTAYGFGGGSCQSSIPGSGCSAQQFKDENFDFGIVDKVKVPNVPAGDYIISFRWDSEQTPQVWSSCGDVTIKSSGQGSKPFTPTRGCTECCLTGGLCQNCTGCTSDKTGACAYCWKPLKGYAPGVPPVSCLGHDTADGHATPWQAGDTQYSAGISLGCLSCWAEKDACKPIVRELEKSGDIVV
jgi:hypothetical protein